ncbi:MAG: hypothetical protein ABIS86_12600 [Streptosporangiaceae bacterium]
MADTFELIVILNTVRDLSDQHWNQLFTAARLMDGKAWVGPSGRAFDREVQRNHRSLQAQLQKAADSLIHKVAGVPHVPGVSA